LSQILKIFTLLLIVNTLFATPYNSDRVRVSLIKKFKQHYPNMKIEHLFISPLSTPPRDFESYKMKAIYISQASLHQYKGTFSILYVNKTKERRLFYKYLLDAKLSLYKTIRTIKRGEIIDSDNVELSLGKFDSVRFEPINGNYLGNYVAKRDIQEDKIIFKKDLKIIPDIKRGDSIDAILFDSGIEARFNVTAMQDGIIGEIIRVRKKHQKVFKAKVLSKTQVEIIE